MQNKGIFLNKLTNDNVFGKNEIVPFSSLTGIPSRKGYEQAIISNGKVVNVVSKSYGHLPNELFFGEVEKQFNAIGVGYKTRSINRNDCSFAVDYILDDTTKMVTVKNGNDRILPMIRLVNSYDGSNKTSGHFGFYREVCSNGLHVAQTDLRFSLKHTGSIVEFSMAGISEMIHNFFDNEYYTISTKFEKLAATEMGNIEEFVKLTADGLKLFKYEISDKNPEPSANARLVMDIIKREAGELNVTPNLWLGYNAFNELIHDKLKKGFDKQAELDVNLFNHILELA
jgi:hypothetical protein